MHVGIAIIIAVMIFILVAAWISADDGHPILWVFLLVIVGGIVFYGAYIDHVDNAKHRRSGLGSSSLVTDYRHQADSVARVSLSRYQASRRGL
jgi:hypothetical protein